MKNVVFSDYHETWTDHPEIWGQVDAIVTSTPWYKSDEVLGDNWVGPSRPVFFNPTSKNNESLLQEANHKASIINKCDVTKFFEDDEDVVPMLQIMCPNTKIIQVKPEMNFI